MYEIVGGLRASLLSAVKVFATGNGITYTHINPQNFIHDVELNPYGIAPFKNSINLFSHKPL